MLSNVTRRDIGLVIRKPLAIGSNPIAGSTDSKMPHKGVLSTKWGEPKMRKWGYGINSIHRTAQIHTEESSWWVFALDRTIEWLCGIIPHIRFPKVKMRLKDAEEIEFNDGSKWTTLQDWYGNTSHFFHLHVHLPVFYFCQSRIKFKSIEIDYDRAREMFYESDKKFWDEVVAYAAE